VQGSNTFYDLKFRNQIKRVERRQLFKYVCDRWYFYDSRPVMTKQTVLVKNDGKPIFECHGELVSLYRAVSEGEYVDLMRRREFRYIPLLSTHSKYFGVDCAETYEFADLVYNRHVAAVVETRVLHDVLYTIADFTRVDTEWFRSGTVIIHPEQLNVFNNAVREIILR
jgi:hypothetical protein